MSGDDSIKTPRKRLHKNKPVKKQTEASKKPSFLGGNEQTCKGEQAIDKLAKQAADDYAELYEKRPKRS